MIRFMINEAWTLWGSRYVLRTKNSRAEEWAWEFPPPEGLYKVLRTEGQPPHEVWGYIEEEEATAKDVAKDIMDELFDSSFGDESVERSIRSMVDRAYRPEDLVIMADIASKGAVSAADKAEALAFVLENTKGTGGRVSPLPSRLRRWAQETRERWARGEPAAEPLTMG